MTAPTWTPERDAVLERRWLANDRAEEILAELQPMPGRPIAGLPALRKRAKRLRIRRPVKFIPPGRPPGRREEVEEEAPALAVEPSPEIADAKLERRLEKARRLARQRKSGPEIVQATRLPLREAFRIIGEERRARA
jgi:hypothetical protein